MNCAVCGVNIKIWEWDCEKVCKTINPLTFMYATIHFDCLRDAMDEAEETESKKPHLYKNRLDEYLTKHL
jgi:hypothetical protein